MRSAPFPPLAPGAEGLADPPISSAALRKRMAEVYGVPEACVAPVCDAAHGRALVERCVNGAIKIVRSPSDRGIVDASAAADMARGAALLLIDESPIEFADAPSLAAHAAIAPNLAVLRSLSFAYGLAGAPCGAVIANADLISKVEAAREPWALSTPTIKLALAVLDPSRMPLTQARWGVVRAERARVAALLAAAPGVVEAFAAAGPAVLARVASPAELSAKIATFGLDGDQQGDGLFRFAIGAPDFNARLLAAFGIGPAGKPARRADIMRDTKETRIVAALDLDRAGAVNIDTGIGFFDHMLGQVALHGGFSLTLTCSGDLHIDAHHTIEDCAIALGQAFDKALGERRGLSRFGFLLPMDETEAQVSIDLGGRPFSVFKGAFAAPLLGAYPTEMTEHVFRSLAENMRAAIHVAVSGGNDHHKTEACFKAFGRALRAAIRADGDETPSTKGVL
jgi:imidazoleglycerol-phosphate dehydratase / histidinol-phosphatase